MEIRTAKSPHHNSRDYPQNPWVVLHHTGGTYEGAIAWCQNPASKVSYHVIISHEGELCQLVPYVRRAWHAGRGILPDGRNDPNTHSIGLAFEGNSQSEGITIKQYDALARWWVAHKDDLHLAPERVTDHRSTRERYLLTYPEQDARLGGSVSAKYDLAPPILKACITMLEWQSA